MKILLAGAAVIALLAFHPVSAQAADVGKIGEVEGAVSLTHGGASAAVKTGDGVAEGDTIDSTEKSRAKIVFEDKTEITVAGKGKLTVDKYVYDSKKPADNKASFSVLGLAFSYVGGLMDKGPKPDVNLQLDFGSIGIRGTKIYRAMNNNECWIYVERGKVDVANKGGEVHLKSGQGTIMSATNKAPVPAHIWSAKDIAWLKDQVSDPRLHKKDWK